MTIEDIVKSGSPIADDLKILFKKKRELRFLDIGACTGEDSIIYSNLFPAAKIIAFEPLPENLDVMRHHLSLFNKLECVQVENIALSDEEGDALFYVSGGSPYTEKNFSNTTIFPKEWNKSSSLLKPGILMEKEIPWLKFRKEIRVETRRLDNYLNEHAIDKIDFIHMDVQGAELKVLQGLGEKIKNVQAIWLEVENLELYEKQPLKREIQDYLSKHRFYRAIDTSKGKTYGDCLFINSFSVFLHFKFFKLIRLGNKIRKRVQTLLGKVKRSHTLF